VSAGGSSWRWVVFATALLPALLAAACTNQDAVLGVVTPPPAGTPVSLSKDVQVIFSAKCGPGCHSGSNPFAGMSLEDGKSHAATVDKTSCEAPGLKRVKPFDSLGSYMILKLEDRQSSITSCVICATDPFALPNCGRLMPFGGPPLSDVEITLIRTWIDQGAQDN